MDYRTYSVRRRDKQALLDFVLHSLEVCRCRVLHHSDPGTAPFRLTFETPDGERMGVLLYAFLANKRVTKNRPDDEYRFQVKYGSDTEGLHDLWQDPFELYTTLFLGINPDEGFFVAADPALHSPTRFFISVEFKEDHVREVLRQGWYSWERQSRGAGLDEPVELMVGGNSAAFLRFVRFERAAKGLGSGHRALLADKVGQIERLSIPAASTLIAPATRPADLHSLATEFQLSQTEILDLIQSAPRLKMAVRGWVAEAHLVDQLKKLPGVTDCVRLEEDGGPDVRITLGGQRPLFIECKNILRSTYSDGAFKLDFQRTRASKVDPCSRYYMPQDFDVVAACMHPRTERWDFRYAITCDLDPHEKCSGRLSNRVRLDGRWDEDPLRVFQRALAA
jgi:hypothetical protein